MHKLHAFIFGLLLMGGLASCTKSIDPSSTAAEVLAADQATIASYTATNPMSGSGTSTSSGLYYAITQPGSSTVTPAYGQELEFTYTLYTLTRTTSNTAVTVVTATKVDDAYASTSIFYPFFKGSLKAGLEEGLLLMHEGDQATLLIPSALAFGTVTSADKKVPANTPVRYDIHLIRSRTEDQQINEYMAANKLTVTDTTTTAGMRFIKTVSNASGIQPTSSQIITIRYSGKLLRSNTPFDSTGTTVTYSSSAMTAGFNAGLAKLKTGEKATVIFPSSLGYKTAGVLNNSSQIVIPPNAPLRYDIELISAQ